MKPIGIVVNDSISVYPENIQSIIRDIYNTDDMEERIRLVTRLLADFKKFLPKCHEQIKFNNGNTDYISTIKVQIDGNSKNWPGILTEHGVIEFQHDGKFKILRSHGFGYESKHDITSTQEAVREAKRTITRNGIESVQVYLDNMDDQLRRSPANEKAQADFLHRLGYKKKVY